jgi:hypothetical protein
LPGDRVVPGQVREHNLPVKVRWLNRRPVERMQPLFTLGDRKRMTKRTWRGRTWSR